MENEGAPEPPQRKHPGPVAAAPPAGSGLHAVRDKLNDNVNEVPRSESELMVFRNFVRCARNQFNDSLQLGN
jgi:hypothetical protein